MRTTALLALILSVLGPSSFFGSKKGGSIDPWQWARPAAAQQQTQMEKQPQREGPNVPTNKPSFEGQMMERAAEDTKDEEWRKIERSGKQVGRMWLRADADQLEKLAEEVQQQSQAELQWLRTIAEKEQATKTVEAIDKLLAAQEGRYTDISEQLKRKQEKADRRTRGRQRTERSRRSRSRRTRPGESEEGY